VFSSSKNSLLDGGNDGHLDAHGNHHHHDHLVHANGNIADHKVIMKQFAAEKEKPADSFKQTANVQQQQQQQQNSQMSLNSTKINATALAPKKPANRYSAVIDNLERIVHIDLKGAPPKPDYFKKFIPFIKENGATGILLEYEDMFPFTGKLAEAKHGNAYTLEDVAMIKKLAEENGLPIMPLVQTYGHLEWLLKVKSFAHLREASEFTQGIYINDFIEIIDI
jgi:hypothetical protein